MKLGKLIDSPCGLRFMVENLNIYSGYSRRILLEKEMSINYDDIEKNYAVLKKFYKVIINKENKNVIQTLQSKLCNLKDIHNTLSRLASFTVLDDIELFEIKHLAMLSSDIQLILEKLNLNDSIIIQNLDEVVRILDPDGLHIATFYIYDSYSEELKRLRYKLKRKDNFQEAVFNQVMALEDEIRGDLSKQLQCYAELLENAMNSLAEVDLNLSKAMQINDMGLCFPMISSNNTSEFNGFFNPEVKYILKQKDKDYQLTNISFGLKPIIITGANMGGKTVVAKTLALCQYLMQFGFGIPAISAKMMIQNDIFYCATDEQSIDKGLSSFAAEMKNIDTIIKASRQNKRILVLIDEPARTTNPTEGTALVSALVKILQDKKISLIIVTHYNINTYNSKCFRVKGLENGKMNYELIEICEGEVPHEALNIAENLGIDAEWINNAKTILGK